MQENETKNISTASIRPPAEDADENGTGNAAAKMSGRRNRVKVAWQTVRRFLSFLLPGNVSRIHYYEARERYFSLKRVVEHEKGLISQSARDSVQQRSWKTLVLCETILDADACLLTRRQENLNRLWRSLTRVTIMLINNVWTDKQLATQLNVCREEAYRLRIEEDPTIAHFLQQIAELIDESGDLGDKTPRVKRALVAAWERFNSIRTRRIHDQYIMSQTYLAAFFFLIVITFLIIGNYETITRDWDKGETTLQLVSSSAGQQENANQTEDAGLSDLQQGKIETGPQSATQNSNQLMGEPVSDATKREINDSESILMIFTDTINGYLSQNVLAFICLGGLAGGFFSVVTRISRHELAPGSDAYFIQYILTKPFVGAFGAIVLFILFAGGLTSFDLVPQDMKLDSNGAVFGVAFLLGFSERFAFPNVSPP